MMYVNTKVIAAVLIAISAECLANSFLTSSGVNVTSPVMLDLAEIN